jgi:hypothetical protein
MLKGSNGGSTLGVTFEFSIYSEHTAPSFNEGEWVAVPLIMDLLKAAKPFFNKRPFSSVEEFTRFIHLVDAKFMAALLLNSATGRPGIALKPQDIAVLAAFRQDVTHILVHDRHVGFKFT